MTRFACRCEACQRVGGATWRRLFKPPTPRPLSHTPSIFSEFSLPPRSHLVELRELILCWIQQELYQTVFQRKIILRWFYDMILWNQLKGCELKKLASPDAVKWFSIMILGVYATESKRIIFSHIITSLKESAASRIRIRWSSTEQPLSSRHSLSPCKDRQRSEHRCWLFSFPSARCKVFMLVPANVQSCIRNFSVSHTLSFWFLNFSNDASVLPHPAGESRGGSNVGAGLKISTIGEEEEKEKEEEKRREREEGGGRRGK